MKKEGKRDFHKIIAVLFIIVGVLHLTRAVMEWPMIIGTYSVPLWISYITGGLLLILSYVSFKILQN